MRVKLSYTAEMDEVLPEAAYMLKNLSETINSTIKNYNELLTQLDVKDVFNANQFFSSVDDIRHALGKIDYRLIEVAEIISGYEKYHSEARRANLQETSPEDVAEEAVVYIEEDDAGGEEEPSDDL